MIGSLIRKPTPIGLDIGRHSIKMLQFESVGQAISAVAAAKWRFPDTAGDDPAMRRRFAVDAVNEMLSAGRFRGRRVVSCLAGEDLAVKQIRLPQMSREDMESAVHWEAGERFGFKVQPDLLHHVVAGEIRKGSEVRNEVILIGARDETVENHVAMLAEMHLKPMSLDVEPASLFRAFERFCRRTGDAGKVTFLVDVGESATRVLLAQGTQVKFIKTINIGGRRFTDAVIRQLNLDGEGADQLRQQIMRQGRDGGEAAIEAAGGEKVYRAIYDAIRPVAQELAQEINLCLRYCAVTFRGVAAEQATLVGGEAYDPCVRELLDEYVNIPCRVGSPLHGIDLSRVDLGADHRGPLCEWSVAAGLALRYLVRPKRSRETSDERNRLSA